MRWHLQSLPLPTPKCKFRSNVNFDTILVPRGQDVTLMFLGPLDRMNVHSPLNTIDVRSHGEIAARSLVQVPGWAEGRNSSVGGCSSVINPYLDLAG